MEAIQHRIRAILDRNGYTGKYDPAEIETSIRLEVTGFENLSEEDFAHEVEVARRCIDAVEKLRPKQQPASSAPGPQPGPAQQSPQPGSELDRFPAASTEYIRQAEIRGLEFMNPKRWQMMEVMAKTFNQSAALPNTIKNVPQLMIVFQAGFEFGLQPVESLQAFYFVNGKLTMYGETVIAQVLKAGHKIEWGTCTAETATVKITRKDNGSSFSQTLTMKEAVDRHMDSKWNKETEVWEKKDVWRTQPDVMLRYRVFGKTARFIVSDALHGVKIKEEVEGYVDAEVIEDEPLLPAAKKNDTASADGKTTDRPAHAPLAEVLEKADQKDTADSVKPADEGKKKTEADPPAKNQKSTSQSKGAKKK